MSTVISNRQQELVTEILAGGNYNSREEVLDEALELLRQREELRRRLLVAAEQLNRGEGILASEVFSRLESEWNAAR